MPDFGSHYAHLFQINSGIYSMNMNGVNDENACMAGAGGGNSKAWIAGHLVYYRHELIKLLGGESREISRFERYRRGSDAIPAEGFLPLNEVSNLYQEFGKEITGLIACLPESKFEEPATISIPGCKTYADLIGFIYMHDSYHLGQLGLARRAVGLPGAVA